MSTKVFRRLWLRDRAQQLRVSAAAAEKAYGPHSKLGRACRLVAAKYRSAAVLLDDAATELEDDPSVLEEP